MVGEWEKILYVDWKFSMRRGLDGSFCWCFFGEKVLSFSLNGKDISLVKQKKKSLVYLLKKREKKKRSQNLIANLVAETASSFFFIIPSLINSLSKKKFHIIHSVE